MTAPPEPAAASIANDGLPHLIVSGLDNLERRTIEELRMGDEPVVAIAADEDEGEGLVRPDVVRRREPAGRRPPARAVAEPPD